MENQASNRDLKIQRFSKLLLLLLAANYKPRIVDKFHALYVPSTACFNIYLLCTETAEEEQREEVKKLPLLSN